MKKVIGVILLLVCVLGIYLNYNEFEIKFTDHKFLNETDEAKEYVMNYSFTSQNIDQEPDYSKMSEGEKAVLGKRPGVIDSLIAKQKAAKEKALKEWKKTWMNEDPVEDAPTPQEIADQKMADFYDPNMSNANKIFSESEPGTKFPEDTEKDKFGILIPFVLIGILGIYFVTRKKTEKE